MESCMRAVRLSSSMYRTHVYKPKSQRSSRTMIDTYMHPHWRDVEQVAL